MAYAAPARWTRQQLRRDIPILPDAHYIGSDDTGHYFVPKSTGLGDIGDMFSRMFKITSKSFTPANISRTIWRATPASWALQAIAPKIEKTLYKDVVPIAVPAVAGAALAITAGPAVWSAIGPKLSTAAGFLGKNASSIGGFLTKIMGGMSPAGAAQVAEQITPQQIAQVEQTGVIPPDVMKLLQDASSQYSTVPAMPAGMFGAADAYPQGGLPPPVKAGMDTTTMLYLFGGLGLAAIILGKK